MPGESLSFPIFAPDHASGNIREVGDAAAKTAAKLDIAAASAKLWNDTTVKSGKAADTALASMKAHTKATGLLADAENVLAGRATTTTKLLADQGRELDKTGKSAEAAAGKGKTSGLSALIGTGSAGGGGMGALIAVGVALSPVIATVGTGLLGVGAAAYGVAKPILAAAQATGGLQANMAKLNPEQKQVAQGILNLGQQFAGFQKQMQPAVFAIFNKGLALAGTLLHGVEPVALSTGKALGGVLGSINAEFKSGTWQQFFAFMARTAGPDIQQLGMLFTSLLGTLPPLLESLQPVGKALLVMATDAAQATTGVAGLFKTFSDNVQGSAHNFNQGAKATDSWVTAFTDRWIPGARAVNNWLTRMQHGSGLVNQSLGDAGDTAAVSGPKFFSLNTAVAALNKSMTVLVGNLLTLQGSELAWKQSLQAAEVQLKSNTAGLEGNSKNALANKQAVLASTQAALSFAQQELATGKNIGGASRTVQQQINWLQGLHDKSAFVKAELAALRREEALLQAQKINQTINVQGLGQWSVSQSLAPGQGHRRATGGRVPGYGGGDRWPALLEGGEAIVPKHLTPAVAPFLKAHGVPGFAAGGLVPSYSGSPAMAPWVKTDDAATIRLIDMAVVRATLAGMRAAQSASRAQTFGGGLGRAGLRWLENLWTGAGGPGGGTAHVAAAIALAESGGNANALNPSGASGLWQILGLPFPGDPFIPSVNARMAVVKYQDAGGFSPWVTFETGAYRQFMDQGGWLPTGTSVVTNNTGQPERVLKPGQGGGNTYVTVNVNVPPTANPRETARHLVEAINQGATAGFKIRKSAVSANG
jgi:Lysozyme like domain